MTRGLHPALARLIAGHIFLHACMAGVRMAAPLVALRQGQSEAAVGVLLALFALTQVFLALPAGRYADRHGLKRPMRLSVVAAASGAALAVAHPVFPVLCLSALLTGGATGAASIALQRHVGRAAENPTQLKQVFSWLAIGPAVSNFLGPFAAGLVIDHGGFRLAFLLMATLPLLSWLWVRKVQELPPIIRAEGQAGSKAWDLLREPMFRRHAAPDHTGAPPRRGGRLARNGHQCIPSVTMPILFGLAGTVIGISGVFWITGAVVAGGTRLAFRLGKR
jgi:MFS family permease